MNNQPRELGPFEDITPDPSIAAWLGKTKPKQAAPRPEGNVHLHVAYASDLAGPSGWPAQHADDHA